MLPKEVAKALYIIKKIGITSLSPNQAEATLEVALIRKGYPNAAIHDPIIPDKKDEFSKYTNDLIQQPMRVKIDPAITQALSPLTSSYFIEAKFPGKQQK